MAQWSGKSKGLVLGYRIFIFCIHKLGVRFAYFVLYFVAFYYFIFSVKASKSSFYYFNKRRGYSSLKSWCYTYRQTYRFGQTLIDKAAISTGLRDSFTFEFDGVNILKKLLDNKKGGVLISAHVGNFELAQYFFDEIDGQSKINLVTTDVEHRAIKNYLDSIDQQSKVKFIVVKEDLSHIFEINQALQNNELVCFTGDRYFEESKVLEADLLGKAAKFPAGPFLIGSRLKVPVVFVYVMKETTKHYHFYTREAQFVNRDVESLLKSYTKSIEWILSKYPEQWFNFYDFWEDLN